MEGAVFCSHSTETHSSYGLDFTYNTFSKISICGVIEFLYLIHHHSIPQCLGTACFSHSDLCLVSQLIIPSPAPMPLRHGCSNRRTSVEWLTSRNSKLSQLIRQLAFLWPTMSKILDWRGLFKMLRKYTYILSLLWLIHVEV